MACGACTTRPLVQLEQPGGESPPSFELAPPQCDELPLPPYPEVAADRRPDQVSVKVTFTIDEFGRTTDVGGEVLEPAAPPDTYLQAAVSAASSIRCKPAARIIAVQDGVRFRPVPYRSSFVYHFFRDEREVQVGP